MKEAGKPVIIKKVKKVTGGGAHGGSWKVAYADFVTAMMAFFLLMWLINMVSPEKKAKLSYYFKYYSIFDKGGWSLIAEGKGVLPDAAGTDEQLSKIPQLDTDKRPPTPGEGKVDNQTQVKRGDIERQKLKRDLNETIQKKLSAYKDQISVSIHKQDVRIEIMDAEGKPIFPLGSAELNPNGKNILGVLCEKLKTLGNKIAIEGHTDAVSFAPGKKMTNWELSTERGNAARRFLEAAGVYPERIGMVVGYAATRPLIKENPNDPRNRRICIVILGSDNATPEVEDIPPESTTTIPETVPDIFPEKIDQHINKPVAPVAPIPAQEADNQSAKQ
ncbi:MAG: OmpA family protein [Desulfobacterota bacterium]|nr:OmpA family protein [Thermodesulfobacteriota bacterium]